MGAVRTPGISGLAIGAVAAGAVLAYAGIRNASVSDTLRALLRGQPVPSAPSTLEAARSNVTETLQRTASSGLGAAPGRRGLPTTGPGAQVADAARKYLGAPYIFGAEGPNAFDCSGLVTWVLAHDLGIRLPSEHHTVTGQFYVWQGAQTVPRPPAAGDLICWTGHIGIAVNETEMIHAPGVGQRVKISRIWWTPAPLVRRVL